MQHYLGISASLRKDSFNTALLRLAAKKLSAEHWGKLSILDLNAYAMPAYDADMQINQGFPKTADALKEQIQSADGLIIASPEYNFSYPGFFKNMIDWLSRYRPMPWSKKPILLLSASPALAGGNRGLWHLRVPFESTLAFVYPDMFSLASSHEALTAAGDIRDPALLERFFGTLQGFCAFAEKVSVLPT